MLCQVRCAVLCMSTRAQVCLSLQAESVPSKAPCSTGCQQVERTPPEVHQVRGKLNMSGLHRTV